MAPVAALTAWMSPFRVVTKSRSWVPLAVLTLGTYIGSPSAVASRVACQTRCRVGALDSEMTVSLVLSLPCVLSPPNCSQLTWQALATSVTAAAVAINARGPRREGPRPRPGVGIEIISGHLFGEKAARALPTGWPRYARGSSVGLADGHA